MTARHAIVDSLLGPLTIAASEDGLTGVWFDDHRYPPRVAALGTRVEAGDDPVLASAAAQLKTYLTGEREAFELPLAPRGAAFSQRVWALLRQIPRGSTTTYGELAAAVGGPGYAQAVGQAVGHNPLSIVVPCHRVLGADRAITGYAGGLDRKRFLLRLEGVSLGE